MGFVGVIVLVIIGIICYNVWFNLKYSEGEQIMMRHKREREQKEKISKKVKEHLRKEYFPENPMLEILNETLNERQKLAIIIMLDIVNTDFVDYRQKQQKEYIDDLTKLFNLSNRSIIDYANLLGVNSNIYKNHLKTFGEEQKLYLVLFFTEMLKQGGNTVNDRFEKAKNKVVYYLEISHNELDNLIIGAEKMLSNYNKMISYEN